MKVEWRKIQLVQDMQDYIKEHIQQEDFDLKNLYKQMGYSARHCERVFKELMGSTLPEYIRAIVLSQSSQTLLQTDKKILEIAMDSNFTTHEGYTRAFENSFGISPHQYRKHPGPIPLFVPYPISSYYLYFYKKEELGMENQTKLCMITAVARPQRKLLFLPSKQATDYFSYCEELGCAWEGLFNSIPNKLETAALLELPKQFVKEGESCIASGVELPMDYDAAIPEGCRIEILEPCEMLYFESEPITKEEEFFAAMDRVLEAVKKYQPEKYGYQYADDIAPRINLGGETAARYAIPVRKIEK